MFHNFLSAMLLLRDIAQLFIDVLYVYDRLHR